MQDGTDTGGATHARLLHAIADLVDEGLPTPVSVRPKVGAMQFGRNETAEVQRWAQAFACDPPVREDHLYPPEGARPAWREYKARGTFLGHPVEVWCSADEPAEVAPAPGVPVAEPLPRRLPDEVTA
jgi:hypothetical protein